MLRTTVIVKGQQISISKQQAIIDAFCATTSDADVAAFLEDNPGGLGDPPAAATAAFGDEAAALFASAEVFVED
ncbi:hypothetical protein CYMTET_28593 [Cymbomonas tetramitiformis]|uniref:Uncharacterized protein n=1 Tax=Cymbomonas tetramitiformis TaxID=36881 RepID=A0AAE0FMY8_9CHLO|nr:hypothetical protein CYMTET_28593 [Cymbomonas tetramitiformis]